MVAHAHILTVLMHMRIYIILLYNYIYVRIRVRDCLVCTYCVYIPPQAHASTLVMKLQLFIQVGVVIKFAFHTV